MFQTFITWSFLTWFSFLLTDEEIDVVTVVERPKFQAKVNPRKRLVSFSAPCSRQTSPVPSPVKKRRYHTKRLQRLSSVGSNATDGTESDDEQRRASHNVLERKRRNDLKYSFQVLRGQIPDLEENQRAPKVTILRRATDFIKQMQERENRLEAEWQREKKRKARLMERLAYLKNHFSLCHWNIGVNFPRSNESLTRTAAPPPPPTPLSSSLITTTKRIIYYAVEFYHHCPKILCMPQLQAVFCNFMFSLLLINHLGLIFLKLANFYGQTIWSRFLSLFELQILITTLPFMEILFIVGILVVLAVCSQSQHEMCLAW